MPKKKARGLLKPDVCLALKIILLFGAFGVLILGEMNAKNVMQEIAFIALTVFVAILARMAQAGEHQGNLIEALEAVEEAIERASGQAEEGGAEEKAPTHPRMSKAYPTMD